jgi:hypothetical protein
VLQGRRPYYLCNWAGGGPWSPLSVSGENRGVASGPNSSKPWAALALSRGGWWFGTLFGFSA